MTTIKRQVRNFKDVDLTFQVNPLTGDIAKKYDDDAIKASIKNLLLTMNYERPFHPEIGSPIYGLLFEPATPVTASVIEKAVTYTLETFEPRARLNYVNVKAKPDQNAYEVTVNFSIVNYYEPFEVTVILQRLR
jgi:phage baseplate assembly protein W